MYRQRPRDLVTLASMRAPYTMLRCRPATWYLFFATSSGCVPSLEHTPDRKPHRNLSKVRHSEDALRKP